MELKTRRTEPNEHIADEVEKCSKKWFIRFMQEFDHWSGCKNIGFGKFKFMTSNQSFFKKKKNLWKILFLRLKGM